MLQASRNRGCEVAGRQGHRVCKPQDPECNKEGQRREHHRQLRRVGAIFLIEPDAEHRSDRPGQRRGRKPDRLAPRVVGLVDMVENIKGERDVHDRGTGLAQVITRHLPRDRMAGQKERRGNREADADGIGPAPPHMAKGERQHERGRQHGERDARGQDRDVAARSQEFIGLYGDDAGVEGPHEGFEGENGCKRVGAAFAADEIRDCSVGIGGHGKAGFGFLLVSHVAPP